MRISGIGVDIENIHRFQKLSFEENKTFNKNIFTPEEIKYCLEKSNPYQHFAVRFCAKEAFIKALYPKGEKGISYLDIEIGEKDRRPIINLNGTIKEFADTKNIKNVYVMLSHDGNYGIANVVLEG